MTHSCFVLRTVYPAQKRGVILHAPLYLVPELTASQGYFVLTAKV